MMNTDSRRQNRSSIVRKFISGRNWVALEESRSLPSSPGVYVIASGDCISHIGTSGDIKRRVSQLRRLATHRGSARVLCVAFCTHKPPKVYWEKHGKSAMRQREKKLKQLLGEPPSPRQKYESCKNGDALRKQLLRKATDWERGYIEATFEIREFLDKLFQPRFEDLWKKVGKPPGWQSFVPPGHFVD